MAFQRFCEIEADLIFLYLKAVTKEMFIGTITLQEQNLLLSGKECIKNYD